MDVRYISNDLPQQALPADKLSLLKSALESIVQNTPPRTTYSDRHLGGLFTGYTGLAYLFLHVSSTYPDLIIDGHDTRSWARQYLGGDRGPLVLKPGNCGLASEKLAFEAVRACVTREQSDLVDFLSNMPRILGPYSGDETDSYPSEVMFGRAGTLYMLRMVRHWMPESAELISSPLSRIADKIMQTDDDGQGNWQWRDKRFFGAGHGDIGIITQLVLSNPEAAPHLSEKLQKLLDLQQEDGNWPSSERHVKEATRAHLVQWCHGATGFVFSLQAIRSYFPQMQLAIDKAISRAQELIQKHGMLTKEPSLCHGIFGNALAIPPGPARDQFLALATLESMEKIKSQHAEIFQPANYGIEWAVLLNYFPGAVWAWMHSEQSEPKFIMYSDV